MADPPTTCRSIDTWLVLTGRDTDRKFASLTRSSVSPGTEYYEDSVTSRSP
jgi:hypothetical protein